MHSLYGGPFATKISSVYLMSIQIFMQKGESYRSKYNQMLCETMYIRHYRKNSVISKSLIFLHHARNFSYFI